MNFEEKFKSWTLEQKVEWALGPNICNLSENMRSIIVDLKAENERLKAEESKHREDKMTMTLKYNEVLNDINDENEKLKGELKSLRYNLDDWNNKADTMEARVKELEVKLNDKEQCCKWCSNDSRIAGLNKRIAELESQLPKWISVKYRLPEEGVFVYAVGKHLEGLLCFKENEWYTKEEVEDEPDSYWELCGYDKDAIDYWMEKPLPPTTEEK